MSVSKISLDDNFVFKVVLKGLAMIFCWSENPIYHLQKQGNILYISKQITKSP